jgi:hypothetical protein
LIQRVSSEGVSIELERDNKVIARITSVDDVQAVRREFPAEADPWD